MGRTITMDITLDLSGPQAIQKLRKALARAGGQLAREIARAAAAAAPKDTGELAAGFKVRINQGRLGDMAEVTTPDIKKLAAIEGGTTGKAPKVEAIEAWVTRKKIKLRARGKRKPLKGAAAVRAVAFLIARAQRKTEADPFLQQAQTSTLARKARGIYLRELRGLQRELR